MGNLIALRRSAAGANNDLEVHRRRKDHTLLDQVQVAIDAESHHSRGIKIASEIEMRLLSWMAARATTAESDPLPLPEIKNRPTVLPPAPNEPDEELQGPDVDGTLQLEEVYTIIDYEDAHGNQTRRRITMRAITASQNGPILRAICHERRAVRSFRCDRIACFIDDDGVVEEPPHFFRETMLVDIADRVWVTNRQRRELPPPTIDPLLQAAREAREQLRAPLSLLVLAAKSDGFIHPEELDIICQWIEEDMVDKVRTGEFGLPILNAMTPLVAKMNPTRASLRTHINVVRHMNEARFERFCQAIVQVIKADGQIAANEIDFLEDLTALRKADFESAIADLSLDVRE
jgi:hypothetical protein